nr:RNase adapter RapZ [Lachnoclostridium sp. An169]
MQPEQKRFRVGEKLGMRLVIVTGMSGAGKSTALKMLEDMGYFCVDNLPIPLLPRFVELFDTPDTEIKKTALGIDVRGGQDFAGLKENLEEMDQAGIQYEILFLDANDEVLVKRYKETRRQHPLSGSGRVDTGIAKEREKIAFLKMKATYILDTSKMLTRELRLELEKIFVEGQSFCNLFITVMSFGFKYGIPQDADLVFDVRFLPNPYYIEGLREKTGNDPEVQDYVMDNDKGRIFLEKLKDMVGFLIPNYILEGKNQLVIAIGCTGGKHRSVTLANALYQILEKEESYGVRIEHRDIGKDAITKRR